MALSTPPSAPTPGNENVFNSAFNAFADWAQTIPSQINILTFSTINATSTTSIAVGSGSKSIVLVVDTAFVVGHIVMCWNSSTNWMLGRVTSYTSGTKTLVFTVIDREGSATLASWTISVHGLSDYIDTLSNVVSVSGGSSFGSTNTKIRRFTTVDQNIGTAITYASSATLGDSFTINQPGWYMMDLQDFASSASSVMGGMSLNTTEPTVTINGQADKSQIITFAAVSNSTTTVFSGGSAQAVRYLIIGDVVRVHYDFTTPSSTYVKFTIAKML